MLGILGPIWEKFSYFPSSAGSNQAIIAIAYQKKAFSRHETYLLVWCLEKIDHIPQMVVSWWFTMIESKKSTLYKPKFNTRIPGLQSPQHGRVEVPGDPAVFF